MKRKKGPKRSGRRPNSAKEREKAQREEAKAEEEEGVPKAEEGATAQLLLNLKLLMANHHLFEEG